MIGSGAPLLSRWAAEAGRELPRAAASLRALSWPGAVVLAAAGIFLLLAGARFRRPLGLAGGAAIGFAAGLAAAAPVGLSSSSATVGGAILVGGLCALFPPAFPIAALALPGAIVAAQLSLGGPPLPKLAAGLLAGALLGLVFSRLVAALAAALLGAGLIAAALLTLTGAVPALAFFAFRPFALAAVVVVLAVAGTAYQRESAWVPRAPDGRSNPPGPPPSPLG